MEGKAKILHQKKLRVLRNFADILQYVNSSTDTSFESAHSVLYDAAKMKNIGATYGELWLLVLVYCKIQKMLVQKAYS